MLKKARLLAAMSPSVLVPLVVRNGISFHPRHLLRCAFLLQSGMWTPLLDMRERILFGSAIRKAPPVENPVFIVGHWRSGSTLLHQLLNCNPALAAPTLLQCTYPMAFMSCGNAVRAVLRMFLPRLRPMDNVPLDPDEPQEDEFALMRMTGISPLERLIFPRSGRYFLLDDAIFDLEGDRQRRWEEALALFFKKIRLHTGKRPVLKNPFHSMRIAQLKRLFPGAKFIHIYRDPRVVVPSTLRLWTLLGGQNALRKEWRPPLLDEIVTGLDRFLERTRADCERYAGGDYVEIAFERLESDPAGTLRTACRALDIDFSESFESGLSLFVNRSAGYRKNKHPLSGEQLRIITTRMAGHMKRYGYR